MREALVALPPSDRRRERSCGDRRRAFSTGSASPGPFLLCPGALHGVVVGSDPSCWCFLLPYLCRFSASSRAVKGWDLRTSGVAWARSVVRMWCARTPSVISVRDPGWLRVGDMMGDGVPLG